MTRGRRTRAAHRSASPSSNRLHALGSGRSASVVAGVEQADPQADVARGGDQRLAHRVRVVVRRAVRLVVEVVELAHARRCRRGASRRTSRGPGRCSRSGSSTAARAYISSRHDQNESPPARPRRARWKTWLWQLANACIRARARRRTSGPTGRRGRGCGSRAARRSGGCRRRARRRRSACRSLRARATAPWPWP